jgi:hypothetical protein
LDAPGDVFGNEIAVDTVGSVYAIGNFSGSVDVDPGPGTYNLTSAGRFDSFVAKYSDAGSFIWAGQVGGAADGSGTLGDSGKGLAVDSLGNVYVAGWFYGTADFDPGPGTFNLTATNVYDGYVLKLGPSGNLLWVAQLSATAVKANSVAVGSDGSVYATGGFSGTADFDPGPNSYNLTSAGQGDIFAVKLDSAGNFVWAQRAGGSALDQSRGVAVASNGVYLTGYFAGTADFGSTNLTSAGGTDNFVAKLDVDTGIVAWAKAAAGAGDVTFEYGRPIAMDASGNVITTGQFVGTVDFDPGPSVANLTDNGSGAAFIWKLNSFGNLVWAKQLDSSSSTGGAFGIGVAVDSAGNIFGNGSFGGTFTGSSFTLVGLDFDSGPGAAILTASDPNGYVLKLDASGNFLWVRSMGGRAENTDDAGIAVDSTGNVVTTASFVGTPMSVDTGNTTVAVPNTVGHYDLYIAKITQDTPLTPQLDRLTDTPDPVSNRGSGVVTLTASDIRFVSGGSNVASVSFYRDTNGNGTLQVGTDLLLGTDTDGSNGWSRVQSIPKNFPTGTYTYFAQAKDSANVTGNVVSTTNTVSRNGAVAALVASRDRAAASVDLGLDRYYSNDREDRDESPAPSHLSGRSLAELLRTRGRR